MSHALHHVLQLHHTLIGFFLRSEKTKNLVIRICVEPSLEKSSISTYNGDLDSLDSLSHLLHLTLQLLRRLHNLRLEFADVLLQAADVHLQLSLRGIMSVSSVLWILLKTFPPDSGRTVTYQLLSLLCKEGFPLCNSVILGIL